MRLSKAEIRSRIKVCGIKASGIPYPYTLYTGGFGGLPKLIELSSATTAFALQRALRACAADRPDLFEADDV